MILRYRLPLKREVPTFFIHTDSRYDFDAEERINLILSPAFYWCKKESLAVKNVYAAKKIAQSVFDGNIPDGDYKYLVRRLPAPGEFLFFAYDEERILEQLNALEIPMGKVQGIYFAQTEFEAMDEPLRITDTLCLIQAEGIVTLMPSRFVPQSRPMSLEYHRLSRFKIPIRTYNAMGIRPKSLYSGIGVAGLLSIIFLAQYLYYASAAAALAAQGPALLKKAELPTTTFQLESIEKNLLSRQQEMREVHALISKAMAVAENTPATIKSFSLDDKRLLVSYEMTTPQTLAEAKKHFPKAKLDQQAKSITLEITR